PRVGEPRRGDHLVACADVDVRPHGEAAAGAVVGAEVDLGGDRARPDLRARRRHGLECRAPVRDAGTAVVVLARAEPLAAARALPVTAAHRDRDADLALVVGADLAL